MYLFYYLQKQRKLFYFLFYKKIKDWKTRHIVKQSVQQMQKSKTKNDKQVLMYSRLSI